MTDQEILYHLNRMIEIYGDDLPNPEQEPKRFAYYVKLYRKYHVQTI